MKKFLSLILSALLVVGVISLSSCTPEETPEETESKSESESASESESVSESQSASASESASESESESESESVSTQAIYKIRFVNESGTAVADVGAQICGGPSEMCMPIFDTDGDGIYTVEKRGVASPINIENNYYIRINEIPTGYTAPDGCLTGEEAGNTYYKILLNDATEITIVLNTAN